MEMERMGAAHCKLLQQFILILNTLQEKSYKNGKQFRIVAAGCACDVCTLCTMY
jgi:hypothetical protein